MDFGYWMLGIIEQHIRDAPYEEGNHKGCNPYCENRWCKLGQRNLILNRIDELKERITTEAQTTPSKDG